MLPTQLMSKARKVNGLLNLLKISPQPDHRRFDILRIEEFEIFLSLFKPLNFGPLNGPCSPQRVVVSKIHIDSFKVATVGFIKGINVNKRLVVLLEGGELSTFGLNVIRINPTLRFDLFLQNLELRIKANDRIALGWDDKNRNKCNSSLNMKQRENPDFMDK
ncbi:hypothetical protein M5K25_005062 [Dendrobium thyrsiflorum]|uniref:Uncharacterized protein n=1 Tax=Dendrobium thyrsiflorum TaxID=117978 RepID=A0ABD0VNM2_DENTH